MDFKDNAVKIRVAQDLLHIQSIWTFWYLIIISAIYFGVNYFIAESREVSLNMMLSFFDSSRVYMAIIGFLAYHSILPFYVKTGVTRRDYFYGTALAATGLAFGIMIVSAILTGILHLLGMVTDQTLSIHSIPFLGSTSSWIMPVVVLAFILLCYYIAGWIIATGFYNRGGWKAVSSILIAVLFICMIELLWQGVIANPIISLSRVFTIDLSITLSLGATLVLIGLVLFIIRQVTRQVPIKIE